MKGTTLAGLLSAALLGGAGNGSSSEAVNNPYQEIVTRNAFALKPPPPPPAPGSDQPPPSSVEVLLTGISTLGGVKKVLLQIADKAPNKKPEFPPPLVEGDVQGRIEVVSIDADKGAVVIKLDGNEKTLTFEKDAPKAGSAQPPGPVPGQPLRLGVPGAPHPAGTVPLPTLQAGATPAANPAAASGAYGVVVGGGASGATGATVGGAASPPAIPGAAGVPSRPLRSGTENYSGVAVGGATGLGTVPAAPTAAGSTVVTPPTPLTREQILARIEEQKRAMREALEARKQQTPGSQPSTR